MKKKVEEGVSAVAIVWRQVSLVGGLTINSTFCSSTWRIFSWPCDECDVLLPSHHPTISLFLYPAPTRVPFETPFSTNARLTLVWHPLGCLFSHSTNKMTSSEQLAISSSRPNGTKYEGLGTSSASTSNACNSIISKSTTTDRCTSTVSSAPSVNQKNQKAPKCFGCQKPIFDRYLLKALDQVWHEDCLKCSCCNCRLGEIGSTLFTKADLILCKRDYLRWAKLFQLLFPIFSPKLLLAIATIA